MIRRVIYMSFCIVFMLVGASALWAQSGLGITEAQLDKALQDGYLVVSGNGVPGEQLTHKGQRKLMALRAAQVDAYRQLLEVVGKLRVTSETDVRKMAGVDDVVRANIEGMVQGAQVVSREYDTQDEVGTVYVRMAIKGQGGVIDNLFPRLHNTPPPPGTKPYAPPPAAPTPTPQAEIKTIDGLILDTTEHAFRPAMVNRVLTDKGEILYDPSKIAQEILVERGSGDYTTDMGKAKALLNERGSTNPLVIRAQGVTRMTDVLVAAQDATAIFAANQQQNFLEAAKVVFVLK